MNDSFESIFITRNRTENTTLAFDAAMDILTDFNQSNLDVSDEKLVRATQQYETSEMNLNHVVKHRNEGSNPDYVMNFNILDTFVLPQDISF